MVRINPYPYVFGFVLVACLYGGHRVVVSHAVDVAVKENTVKLKGQYDAALLKASKDSRLAENDLEKEHEATEKVKDTQIKALTSQRDDALRRLQYRTKRPTDSTKIANDSKTCTGAKLYREDGEFLVRESAAAARVVKERDYYYQEYENARKKLNEYATSH